VQLFEIIINFTPKITLTCQQEEKLYKKYEKTGFFLFPFSARLHATTLYGKFLFYNCVSFIFPHAEEDELLNDVV